MKSILQALIMVLCIPLQTCTTTKIPFVGFVQEIPVELEPLIIGRSWKADCPVPLADLRYITVSHWGYDDCVHLGTMVVHALLADELIEIFKEIFEAHFPIERMEIIDLYDADDDRSMNANNSSAFCSRAITNSPGLYSNHSYGIAIDINPIENPYQRFFTNKQHQILPACGALYADRGQQHKGMIKPDPDNACYQAFVKRGYEWGGSIAFVADGFTRNMHRIDYQHFSKKISDVGK